ncbi:MAG TPA: hypothetical protein VE987_19350, partial [Polyangiaceae bacterium]|nr:hypothetical protein [Polyangiaceae bacterium]
MSAVFVGCGSNPPAPASVTVAVVDNQVVFAPTGNIDLQATAHDGSGAAVTSAKLEWTVSPPDAATLLPNLPTAPPNQVTYKLAKEGSVRFQACTAAGACGAVVVLVANKPALSVTAPIAGSELGGDGSTSIAVAGKVTSTRA